MNTIPEETMEMLRAMGAANPPLARDATLRDMFAGMALQGMIASGDVLVERLRDYPDETIGSLAYSAADEMLAARKEAR